MPSSCWEKQNGVMLTEIAMEVRQQASGVADMNSSFAENYYLLKKALIDWEPSVLEWTQRVDNSVRNLIEAVLLETERNDSFWIKRELERYNGLQKNTKPIPS